MTRLGRTVSLMAGASALALATAASAGSFDIPGGDLKSALDAYAQQTGVSLVVSEDSLKGVQTKGVRGNLSDDAALSRILTGTGFSIRHHSGSAVTIVHDQTSENNRDTTVSTELAQAIPAPRGAVETVTVTSSKLGGGDVQSIPISITALSQEQLTATQTAGGPDLIKQVPNMTFTKTNFSGYSIQLRGIGTQAISVTTDPAVAVAFNDIPFIRNHFFEQEFYDVSQVEVLRGPQGTLYGRNATAGVVNLISAKPTDQFEAMASADIGNYQNRRLEAMINIPIVDDRLDLRVAGEWTKRNGYTTDATLGAPVDGRDLWSGRLTIGWNPTSDFRSDFIWEHFGEDDDRLRSGKQLCETAQPPSAISGQAGNYSFNQQVPAPSLSGADQAFLFSQQYLSQGCQATSLYSASAFEVPYGPSIPYVVAAKVEGLLLQVDPYADTTQSTNLRQIQSEILPTYRAKNDTLEYNATYNISPVLTFTSQTGFNQDLLWSTEDYNRFDTTPGMFAYNSPFGTAGYDPTGLYTPNPAGYFLPDPAISGSRYFLRSAIGLFGPARCPGPRRRTCLAVEPGVPPEFQLQRPLQFQHRRQLSPLRDRGKLLCLRQCPDGLFTCYRHCSKWHRRWI